MREQTERTLADPRAHSERNGLFFRSLRSLWRRALFSLTALAVAEGSFHGVPQSGRREWWACLDLNQGPSGYEPVALTTELQALRFNASAPRGSPECVVYQRVNCENLRNDRDKDRGGQALRSGDRRGNSRS